MPSFLPPAGNTVILKMAQQTPLVAERYAQAFKAAGLPESVFQFLHLDHASTAKVVGDERIAFVAFTGSVGRRPRHSESASERFIATGLELGGKDPAYVRADADLPSAIENLVDGSFFNSGQSCCGIERIYVDKEGIPRFRRRLRRSHAQVQARQIRSTRETTLGPRRSHRRGQHRARADQGRRSREVRRRSSIRRNSPPTRTARRTSLRRC
jgi:acyl-CoA reductase-like NAD-dependent aldehyde dehydrogenase